LAFPPFALVRRPAASPASGCVRFTERLPVNVERAPGCVRCGVCQVS